jgi:predicted nicotinamide N-methyase
MKRTWWRKRLRPLRRRRRRSLYLQTIVIPGGHGVHVLHDFRKSAGTDAAHAAFFGYSGSVVWTASTALIRWLGTEPDRVRKLVDGASILELGSGIGFVGNALRKLGAARVLMTDLPAQMPQLRQNVRANREQAAVDDVRAEAHHTPRSEGPERVSCCRYSWGASLPSKLRAHHWDLVVGCDVVHAVDQVQPLVQTLATLLMRGRGGGGQSKASGDARGRDSRSDAGNHSHHATGIGGESRTRVLLALADRTDNGYRRRDPTSGEWSPVIPDYEMMLAGLETRMGSSLDVLLLDVVPPESAEAARADCGTSVHVLLLSCRAAVGDRDEA